ncbi:acyl-CoA carboxylase subunit epsilon [Amycolatopsis panacis]|uniref:Acyl-CoA carboxylase subunit epsilon n=1 Tax=Amycolatopsis panacis TaxID=2340917 RepID=A0A419I4Z3_9PSEU|nr:acyl-CoA carboxylase subunit epsilon [Amycolatopsis panacis]
MADPTVRIVRGNPDEAEVAALMTVLPALGVGAGRDGVGGSVAGPSSLPGVTVPRPRRPVFVPATSWRVGR